MGPQGPEPYPAGPPMPPMMGPMGPGGPMMPQQPGLSDPGMPMLPPQEPSPPPPISLTSQTAPPPAFNKKFLAYADEYIQYWLKTSAELVRRKQTRWRLLEDLYHNRRSLHRWNEPLQAVANDIHVMDNKRWQSDFVVSCVPVVQSFVDRLFGMLFDRDEYFQVIPEPDLEEGNVEDPDYPTSQKFQALLLQKNRKAFFKTRTYSALTDHGLFGTVISKVFYYKKDVVQWRKDFRTGETFPVRYTKEFPVIEPVPLNRSLPDWRARHSDCQRWSGIGHRIDLTVEHILNQYRNGNYTLNRDEFEKRFQPGGAGAQFASDPQVWQDRDSWSTPDESKSTLICCWEWHGEIPVPQELGGGTQEIIAAYATERNEDDPTSGVMVRCDAGPALETGDRPFCAAHFTPLASVFGHSAVEPNMDVIYYLSSMVNTVLDNARLSTNVMLKARRGSALANNLAKGGNKADTVYPGKVWVIDDPKDIMPFEPLAFPAQAMMNITQYFEHMYQQRTTVSDATLSLGQSGRTATDAFRLGQMADVPLSARLDLFVENWFEPYGNMCLGMLQNRVTTEQNVNVPDWRGQPVVKKTISLEEIRTGSYRVQANTNKWDQVRMAKAQSFERAMPTILQFQMPLLQENIKISYKGWLRQYLELLEVPHIDQILIEISPEQAQQIIQSMMPPPQPGPGGNGGPPGGPPGQQQGGQPSPLGENGTPMGPEDMSEPGFAAQLMQAMAQARTPQEQPR